jgi:alkylation response protein AidB-like acyl-CoA dehydrogenase
MEYATECAICKVYGSETLDFVADESLQLHGGYGFIKEYKIEQIYRDSRINRIFEGTNEVNRLLIPGNLFKAAAKGLVPLEAAAAQAMEEMQSPKVGSISVISREIEAVKAIRRVFLLCAGIASRTYGPKLGEEQETLMNLADIAITLFAVESAVLRTAKAIDANGEQQAALKIKLANALVDDALLETEFNARKLLQGTASERELHDYVPAITKELSRLQRAGAKAAKRSIAEKILAAEQYTS